jgi:hypothetical protein
MSKVIDSGNNIIYTGSFKACNDIIRLSHCHPADVTEQDEITYHDFLFGTGWAGVLNVIKDEED